MRLRIALTVERSQARLPVNRPSARLRYCQQGAQPAAGGNRAAAMDEYRPSRFDTAYHEDLCSTGQRCGALRRAKGTVQENSGASNTVPHQQI